MGWDALSVVSAEIPRAMTLLFDAQDGANFVYGRLPIGASDYSMSWYTLAETENDYTMEHFSIARDEEMLIPYVRAALEIKPELRLWGSPWVVPSWMMSGRNMKNDAQTLEAHALYFAKFVQEYAKQGLIVEAVHQQNEPGYARVTWTHPQFIDFIKTYLGPKFEELSLSAGAEGVILGCTEITLLIQQAHSPIPVYDTTAIHAVSAIDWALEGIQI
jgi:glucosylceramidase